MKRIKKSRLKSKPIAKVRRLANMYTPRQWSVMIGTGVIAIVALGGLGIYGLGWRNAFAGGLSAVIPYQAMSVDGTLVSYHQFYGSYERVKAMTAGSSSYTSAQINSQADQKVISEVLVQTYAKHHHITVSHDDVDGAYGRLAGEYGTGKDGEKAFAKAIGVGKSLTKTELYNRLLAVKVNQEISTSDQALGQTKAKAQAVLSKLKQGGDIDALAALYSALPSGQMKGDQALIPASRLPRVVAATATGMIDGQIAAAPIHVGDTYYIVKRVKAQQNDVMLRVIAIRSTGFLDWLNHAHDAYSIMTFVPK